MTKTAHYNIVRRAYGEHAVIGSMFGTWVEAECFAMEMQAERKDGEYRPVLEGQPIKSVPSEYGQSGLDWL